MKIEVEHHVYLHHCDEQGSVLKRLDEIVALIIQQGIVMSKQLDSLKAAVTRESTVIDSAITLLTGLSAQITALKDDPVALQALADEVTAKAASLAAAVAANTPSV